MELFSLPGRASQAAAGLVPTHPEGHGHNHPASAQALKPDPLLPQSYSSLCTGESFGFRAKAQELSAPPRRDQALAASWNRGQVRCWHLTPMGQAPNTTTMGCHQPSPDGPGSRFTPSPPGPAEGVLPRAKGKWLTAGGWPLALETPGLAQTAAPAPITARPWPTAVGRQLTAQPGQLSIQPRANKRSILQAEGRRGHQGGCLGYPSCLPRPARALAAWRQGAAQLGQE